MRLDSRTIALLCVVSSMAVFPAVAPRVLARPLSCCNETTYECGWRGALSPHFGPQACPVGLQVCSDTIGIACGNIVDKCQVRCDCLRDIDEACCLALNGRVVEDCTHCREKIDADVVPGENQEDDCLLPDGEFEEESDALVPSSNAWALAIPAFLFLPVVPVMLRRRRNR